MEPLADPNASPRQLRKALEWELSLDTADLRSHAWYHGSVPRSRAEELISHDGDFLIRDCISQPGDYVLTCRWKDVILHFVINKIIIQTNTVYERVQYQLEDDSYETVTDLVTCYVGSGKPISSASGARICRPVNRSMPLSFYATRYGHQCHSDSDPGSRNISPMSSLKSVSSNSRPSPMQTPQHTPNSSPPLQRRDMHAMPPLPEKHRNSVGAILYKEESSDSVGSSRDHLFGSPYPAANQSVQNLCSEQQSNCSRPLMRADSEPLPVAAGHWMRHASEQPNKIRDGSSEVSSDAPPPKPGRSYSTRYSQRHYYHHPHHVSSSCGRQDGLLSMEMVNLCAFGSLGGVNDCDSGNGSGDSVQSADLLLLPSSAALATSVKRRLSSGQERHRRPVSDTRHSYLDLKGGLAVSNDEVERSEEMVEQCNTATSTSTTFSLPPDDPPSAFQCDANDPDGLALIRTLLPKPENKPLDGAGLCKVRSILLECGPCVLAAHLTSIDLEVLRAEGLSDLGLGVTHGLELITLPHGKRLRLDLLERIECMKLFIAVTILTALNEEERINILRKWIEVAIDIKTGLGNLYSFTVIMLGLNLPQIQRLKLTWHVLRQSFTEIAITYETKLRATLKAMNESCEPQAPNTTIPHIIPLILAMEKDLDDHEELTTVRCVFPWEQSSADYGAGLLLSHLDSGRTYIKQCNMYKRNGEIALECVKFEELLLTMFRTQFHLRFLWGSRGALVNMAERHAKFEKVLTAMSERCESG